MKYGIIELHDSYDFSTQIAHREVVMCKDCVWHTSDDECTSPHWDCEESIIYPQAYESDFCSYGEREGE